MSHDVIFALDIGTTKVCMIAGRKNEYGRVEILGVGHVPSKGVMRGVVSNLEKTTQSILEAKAACEKAAGCVAKEVHVGIAGRNIHSTIKKGLLTRKDYHNEISEEDVRQLINDMNRMTLPPGDKILHIIPQEYTVDNERGVQDPVGMAGVRLEGDFHIITAQNSISKNIHKCVTKAGMTVSDLILEPIASSAAILSEEEKEGGVALLDVGGGTADLVIYHEGILRSAVVIPFGGNIISEDIKQGCKVMKEDAEKLKVKFGKALASEVVGNRYIAIKGLNGRDPKEISEKNLAHIIEARATEIIEFALRHIESSGFEDKLIGGLVITGGGSLLSYFKELTEYQTGISTRIGMPIDILAHGYSQEICHPKYSTVLGLLLHGISKHESMNPSSYAENLEEAEEKIETEEDMESAESRETKENLWKQFRTFFGAQSDTEI